MRSNRLLAPFLDKSLRDWFRFSVRGLLVLVLVLGVWLGWLVRRVKAQQEAVRTIQQAGGFVQYDWELYRGLTIPGARPPAPDWLVKLIGIDYFGKVVVVRLNVTEIFHKPRLILSDATLTSLGALTHLESLALDGTSLDDAGLAKLGELRHLKWLGLSKTHVTDAGLAQLKGKSDLQWLSLRWTGVTAAGIQDLRKSLPSLTVIH